MSKFTIALLLLNAVAICLGLLWVNRQGASGALAASMGGLIFWAGIVVLVIIDAIALLIRHFI